MIDRACESTNFPCHRRPPKNGGPLTPTATGDGITPVLISHRVRPRCGPVAGVERFGSATAWNFPRRLPAHRSSSRRPEPAHSSDGRERPSQRYRCHELPRRIPPRRGRSCDASRPLHLVMSRASCKTKHGYPPRVAGTRRRSLTRSVTVRKESSQRLEGLIRRIRRAPRLQGSVRSLQPIDRCAGSAAVSSDRAPLRRGHILGRPRRQPFRGPRVDDRETRLGVYSAPRARRAILRHLPTRRAPRWRVVPPRGPIRGGDRSCHSSRAPRRSGR